jgi:type IV pilus assembly protein PilM
MADKNTILALNLGSQRVSLARFLLGKKGALTMRDYASEELPGDVTSDSGRVAALKAVVKSLAKQIKAKDEEVIYAIPSQYVISKPVKLPSLGDEAAAGKIVGYEAQQAVPFPLSETVWNYQVISKDGPESEVLIAAVRSEQLEEINEAVEAAGLKPVQADAAPFALYNAFRHNYGVPEQPTLLLDLGGRTTDAIFMEGEKVFIASLPNAGGHVTKAISSEAGVDYDTAEAQKREVGFVNLGGNYEDHEDQQVDAMSKIIRNQFTRLHADINRRVQQYRQGGGSAPTQIFLAGGGSAMPYTKEFFEEKFRLPVEWFNALGNVPLGSKVDAELAGSNSHTLGETVGLALQATGKKQPLSLDLSPRSVEAAKDLKSKKPKLFAAAALLLAGLAFWWFQNKSKTAAHEKTLVTLTKELSGLKKEADAITAETNKGNKALAWSTHLSDALAGRQYWLDVMNKINAQFKDNEIWLTQISPLDQSGNPITEPLIGKNPPAIALADIGLLADKVLKGKPGEASPTNIDSLLVLGLWRGDNKEAPKDLLLKFKALTDYFDIPDNWGDNPNAWYVPQPTSGRYASPFQIRLKLKKPLKSRLIPEKR